MSGGHKDKTQWCTIEVCLFICILHEQVWSGCILRVSVAQTGVWPYIVA